MPKSNAIFEVSSYPKATCDYSKDCNASLHLHRHIEFICIESGSVEFTINGEKHILSGGTSALIVPYTPHSYRMLTEECVRFVIVFEPEYIGSLGEILLKCHPTNPVIPGDSILREFSPLPKTLLSIAHHIKDAEQDNLAYALSFSEVVSFIGKVLTFTGLSENNSKRNRLYRDIIAYCGESFSDAAFDIQSVARHHHISTSRIQQLLNDNIGISFKKYITLLRINKAKSLLKESDMPMGEIAAASGFNSTRTFNRIFSMYNGISPLQYKKASK